MKHYKKLMRTWLITGSIMTAIPVIARMTVATMFTVSRPPSPGPAPRKKGWPGYEANV